MTHHDASRLLSANHHRCMENDTDVMLAMLSSLLEPPLPPNNDLLNALVDCDGDITRAAETFKFKLARTQAPSLDPSGSGKRKRGANDLDHWLVSPKGSGNASSSKKRLVVSPDGRNDDDMSVYSGKPIKLSAKSLKPVSRGSAKVVDLMTVLRPSALEKSVPSAPRLPPLTLSNPAMVEQHTPCTLHLSVLPPELASELFHTMVDAAQGWSRNKWWLFDRVVESPHRTSFFARKDDGVDGSSSWLDAARWW